VCDDCVLLQALILLVAAVEYNEPLSPISKGVLSFGALLAAESNDSNGLRNTLTSNGWQAGGASVQHITAASTVRGFSFQIPTTSKQLRIGLSTVTGETDASAGGITWSFSIMADGRYAVFNEATSEEYRGAYRSGDTFEVRVNANTKVLLSSAVLARCYGKCDVLAAWQVEMVHIGNVVYTSASAISLPAAAGRGCVI